MSNWMKRLHTQYEKLRAQYPEDKLLILFDIDGTILDMRCMMLYVLKAYDEEHGTEYFEQLRLADVTVHENQVETLLKSRNIPSNQRRVCSAGMWSTGGLPARSYTRITRSPV